ncbi:hypothetical protein D3C75_1306670 [compost metagenome]
MVLVSNRTPSRSSRELTCLPTNCADMCSTFPAALNDPVSTAFTKACILVKRSILKTLLIVTNALAW